MLVRVREALRMVTTLSVLVLAFAMVETLSALASIMWMRAVIGR